MRLEHFSSTKFLVIGAFLIFGGCLSIALGIPSATPLNRSFPFGLLGYGIWGGLIYVVAGLVNIGAACKTTPRLVITCLILNIVCCILAVLQLALGISAANQDFIAMRLRNLYKSESTKDLAEQYGNFTKAFFPMTYQVAISKNLVPDIHEGVVAVDSLLAISGFLIAIVASLAATTAAVVVCCPNTLIDLDALPVVLKKKEKRAS